MYLGISHLAFKSNSGLINYAPIIKDMGIVNLELVFAKGYNEIINCGLNIKSTQSILHQSNVKDIVDSNMYSEMVKISDNCKLLGIELLVLGAPTCRATYNYDILLNQFSKIDQYLRIQNQILCIEPNSKEYGGKYFHTVKEIVDFLIVGGFTNIKTMIDTHNLILEREDILSTYETYNEYIAHIHISENKLSPFVPSKIHLEFSKLLRDLKYDKIITNEVLNPDNVLDNIKQFTQIYGN
jgi:sugar phosphate isomerase/epimerase